MWDLHIYSDWCISCISAESDGYIYVQRYNEMILRVQMVILIELPCKNVINKYVSIFY